jgi:hypothetical protein
MTDEAATPKPPAEPETVRLSTEEALPADLPHQARQVIAGLLALVVGVYDAWWKGADHQGFDISFDTVLLMTGLYLISGVKGIAPISEKKTTPPTEKT